MVEFSRVSKTYDGSYDALKNVDLTINDGEFVFVVGASGAGKSTFLKLIMREEVPTSGTVTINGFNLNKMKKRDIPYFRRTMGIVFQDFRLIPDMRVYDNVAFALRVTGTKEREVRKRVSHALGMVGLLSKAQSLPKELSGGEQQRVAIARALVNNAGLIIADEPTGNIDPAMSIEIMDLLNHINKANGTTIIMVTHAHELVKQYAHRVVVLKDGQLIADGYDRERILSLINPETPDSDAGFYNAPNEFKDVENFISSYGKEDMAVEETIPAAPEIFKNEVEEILEQVEEKTETVENTEAEPAAETAETADSVTEAPAKPVTETEAYSVAKDETINSILAAFAASTASRKFNLRSNTTETENIESAEKTEDESPVSASDDNGGDA